MKTNCTSHFAILLDALLLIAFTFEGFEIECVKSNARMVCTCWTGPQLGSFENPLLSSKSKFSNFFFSSSTRFMSNSRFRPFYPMTCAEKVARTIPALSKYPFFSLLAFLTNVKEGR